MEREAKEKMTWMIKRDLRLAHMDQNQRDRELIQSMI